MKQLYYLSTTDIGIERKNIATLSMYPQNNLLPAADKIEQFPYVTQVLKGHFSLLPKTASMAMHFKGLGRKTTRRCRDRYGSTDGK